jgi:hypothetical protein
MTTNNILFVVAIPILLSLAPTATFALPANQTNQTNSLLKAILDQQKLQIQLQQDNANVQSIKLDIIKAELEKIQTTLSTPPTIPPPPPFLQPPSPPIPSSSLNATLNGTICKPQNDNGVLIYPCPPIPTFPTLEQPALPPLPPLPPTSPPSTFPVPLPPGAVACGNAPCSPFPPPLAPDCIYTEYGVFCPN